MHFQCIVVQFAVCLDNEGYEASLEVGKLYRIVVDEAATAHGLMYPLYRDAVLA